MDYDRAKEVKVFNDSKAGVKGLLDSGVSKVPRIFIRPQEELEAEKLNNIPCTSLQLPIIVLSDTHENIVETVTLASQKWSFFQVINHGIPMSVLEDMIGGIRAFHEQDEEAKKVFYSRDPTKPVTYECNYDLFQSPVANWRDTLNVTFLLSDQVDPNEVPQVCRDSAIEYTNHVTKLGHTLLYVLSEALGLKSDNLNSIECAKERIFVCHYYPPCPEPNLTLGFTKHTDPSFITILLQDQLGGLQVIHENQWVNIEPVEGALVVNIWDLLQIISNNKFKSVERRVVASKNGPRISTACFFVGVVTSLRLYGPIEQLISQENPKLFKDFTLHEFITAFYNRPLDTASLTL